MAFIMSTGAILRMLAARRNDPLVQWIEERRIRPFVAAASMASVLHEINTSDQLTHPQRTALRQMYKTLDGRIGAGESVTLAIFDLRSAEILADILAVPQVQCQLSEMDLIPAAIAVQHNHDLVIADHHDAWAELAAKIERQPLDVLRLRDFEPLAA